MTAGILASCGGDEGGTAAGGGGGGGGTQTRLRAGTNPTAGSTSSSSSATTTENTPSSFSATTSTGGSTSGGTSTHAAIGNLIAAAENVTCDYVPHGALSGADLLNVNFFILLIGANPNQLPSLVAVSATSDTGLSTSLRSSVSNRGTTAVQFALRPSDFGRTHTITVIVDPTNEIDETDESDNRIRLSVRLPVPRPTSTITDLSCSARST